MTTHTHRTAQVVAVVLGALALLGGQLQGATAQASAARRATLVHRVSPLDDAGHLKATYPVAKSVRGKCWTTSFVNGRAYRCMEHNLIRDPCWKERGRHSVVCLALPWSAEVIRLRLTAHLPARGEPSSSVWGLRVGGGVGVRCVVSMGASGTVGGRPISYYCRHGWVLLGRPNRSQPVWTIGTAKRVGNHYERQGRKPLTTAWRPVVR